MDIFDKLNARNELCVTLMALPVVARFFREKNARALLRESTVGTGVTTATSVNLLCTGVVIYPFYKCIFPFYKRNLDSYKCNLAFYKCNLAFYKCNLAFYKYELA